MSPGRTDLFLMTATNYIAYWFGRGKTPAETVSMSYAKWGEFFRPYEQSAVRAAQIAKRAADIAANVPTSTILSELLQGEPQPYHTVAVRVLVRATSARTGDQMLGSKVIESTWTNTLENVMQAALERLCRDHPSWCDAEEPEFEILPPLLFPHSTNVPT